MDYGVTLVAARLGDLTEHTSDGLMSADLLPWSATELWKSRLAAAGNCWPGKDHPLGQPTSPWSFHLHWWQASSQQDPYSHLPMGREAKLTPQWWQGSSVWPRRGALALLGTHFWHTQHHAGSPNGAGWKSAGHCSLPSVAMLKLQLPKRHFPVSAESHKDKNVVWFQGLRPVLLTAYYGKWFHDWLLCQRHQLLVQSLLLQGRLNKCSPIPTVSIRFAILLALKLFL